MKPYQTIAADIFSSLTTTEGLALWGAITGTIGTISGLLGIWLRFRHYLRDQPRLKCDAVFDFLLGEDPTPKHMIVVRCVGRRPVTIDSIEYFYAPPTLKGKLMCRYHWRKGKYRSKDDENISRTITLSEGQKVELPIRASRLPALDKVARVRILDQTGRSWRVKWPNHWQFEAATRNKLLERIEEDNAGRTCKIKGYSLTNKFFICARWSVGAQMAGKITGRTFSFGMRSDYDEKMEEIRSVQLPEFLAGNRQEII